MFIRTSNPIAAGVIFDMTIMLPDGSASKVKVRSVRALSSPLGRITGTRKCPGSEGLSSPSIP